MTINDTVRFVIDGDVSLHVFTAAMQRFTALIDAISSQVSPASRIEWYIEELQAGSAIAVVRAKADDPQVIQRAVKAFEDVGYALQRGEPTSLPLLISRPANDMVKIIRGGVTALRFETENVDFTVRREPIALPGPIAVDQVADAPLPPGTFGAVEGTIEALFRRRGHRFTLYDRVFDRAVSCYLREDQEEMMRGLWGHRAIVEGWVTRDPFDGHPTSIRRVTAVHRLPEVEPGSYRRARGVLAPWPPGPSPAEVIRQLRDE